MILVIDNYDSFTFNLVQYLGELGAAPAVYRNDRVTLEEISRMNPEKIVISPGPGRPERAGICIDVIRTLGPRVPILGVCLGHQAIGAAFGARVVRAPFLMHGKTSRIRHDGRGIYREVENPLVATRYHSLVVDRQALPGELEVVSEAEDGTIMGIRHRAYPVEGVQFHPESILTREGKRILGNFLAARAPGWTLGSQERFVRERGKGP
ncbi:MAG: aminodeoxychorismate/anthranilate synthase component II [Firmicutes bacterium]|nr:aminodeoxychorismate/anthranilate synthase component II [Bacillota bacterium]